MLCFRLFSENNPAVPLADAVAQLREGHAPKDLYAVEPASFQHIPNAPFAYWVSERIRRLFVELPALEKPDRTARQGLATANDFRFIRLNEEIDIENNNISRRWHPIVKGKVNRPYFFDFTLYVNWDNSGEECKQYINQQYPYLNGNSDFVAKNTTFYFRHGITWPSRPFRRGFFCIVPRGSIFSHTGTMIFDENDNNLFPLCTIMNSSTYISLLHLLMARGTESSSKQTLKYEVGYIQSVPIPIVTRKASDRTNQLIPRALKVIRHLSSLDISSSAFHCPAMAPSRSFNKTSRT
jgi:hypothetical protein